MFGWYFYLPYGSWTLQWKELNLYRRGRVLKITTFEGPMILRVHQKTINKQKNNTQLRRQITPIIDIDLWRMFFLGNLRAGTLPTKPTFSLNKNPTHIMLVVLSHPVTQFYTSQVRFFRISEPSTALPRCSMYGIFTYIYH